MLPTKHRLMLRHFPDFFVQSKKLHSPLFTLFYIVGDMTAVDHPSLGAVIVPKKKIPLATGRNKIKRQVSELLYSLFKTKPNITVAVLVKKPLAKLELDQIMAALKTL